MKRSFSTVACMNAAYEEIIRESVCFQMDGVEIRLDNGGGVCGLTDPKQILQLKKSFSDHHLEITDLGSSACFVGYNTEALKIGKNAVDTAALMDVKGVRVFLGNFAARTDAVKQLVDYAGIVTALQELSDYAQEKNVEIWIETHNEFSTGRVLKKLLSDINREKTKIIWDVMHPLEAGEDLEETWAQIGDKIAHVHIKDGYDRKDPEWNDYRYTCMGEGALPLFSLFDLLKKADYKGYVSLEWETAWRSELKGLPGELSFALKQYNDLMNHYENNMIGEFGKGWTLFQSFEMTETDNIAVSAQGAILELAVEESAPAMRKYHYRTKIEKDASYRISVSCDVVSETRKLAHYGLISLSNEDKTVTRRLYLERVMPGKLELCFTSEEECELLLELGLKTPGKVKWYRPSLQKIEKIGERKVRIGAVHIKNADGDDYQDNLRRIEEIIDKAAETKADILSFSETIGDRGTTLPIEQIFEPMDGAFCTMMREKAKQHHCYMTFTFHELDEKGERHNTAVLVDRQGEIVGTYRKSHLALAEFEEGMTPGNSYPVFDTEFGKIGMLTCWDAYFPEPAKIMALQGAEILFVSTAGNPTYRHVARAMENGVYVVVACVAMNEQAGIKATKIINPRGEVLAHTNTNGEVALAEIDLNKKDYIFWLSVGGSNTIPAGVYRNEARDDMIEWRI